MLAHTEYDVREQECYPHVGSKSALLSLFLIVSGHGLYELY